MTTDKTVMDMLLWSKDETWYASNPEKGYYLTEAAPQEARESFKKWAAHQDSLGEEGYDYTL